jgi:hypothetical protein
MAISVHSLVRRATARSPISVLKSVEGSLCEQFRSSLVKEQGTPLRDSGNLHAACVEFAEEASIRCDSDYRQAVMNSTQVDQRGAVIDCL